MSTATPTFGPRELKDPRSKDYAIQTIGMLKILVQMKQADESEIAKELQIIKKYKHWEVLGYPSEDAMLKAEVGLTRDAIAKKFGREAKPPSATGRPEKGSQCLPLPKGSNSSARQAARIARDRPDILERMKAGEFPSVHAAALEAGIVKKKVQIPLDPERASNLIRKHFTSKQVEDLIWYLTDAPQGIAAFDPAEGSDGNS